MEPIGANRLGGCLQLIEKYGAGDGTRTRDVQLGNLAHHCVYNTYASLTRFFNSRKSRHISHSRF